MARVNIGYDARILAVQKCGISTYLDNLARRVLDIMPDARVFLFSKRTPDAQYDKLLSDERVHTVVSDGSKANWAQTILPQWLRHYEIAVYHAVWNRAVPFRRPCPCVLTVFDLIPWKMDGYFSTMYKAVRYKLQQAACAHAADWVITASETSKRDLVRLCRVGPKKISITPLGVEDEFLRPLEWNEVDRVLAKYKLRGDRYIIDIVGLDGQPRRNPMLVLRAFQHVLKRGISGCRLVFTGKCSEKSECLVELRRGIERSGLSDKIILTGWVPTPELHILLASAELSIVPSLYEGFGLPILESFACRVPVICTECGAIPEVAGDAALYVKPHDAALLANTILRLLEDNVLCDVLVQKGRKRLDMFSWRECARSTVDVYNDVTKRGRHSFFR